MGLYLSLLLPKWKEMLSAMFNLTDSVETTIARSISFGSKEGEQMLRSFSFSNKEEGLEKSPKSCQGQMLRTPVPLQGLVVTKEVNKNVESFTGDESRPKSTEHVVFSSPRPVCELDHAATKLQKVYKSYRTRRNLADCAVVVEELWWKALEVAALNQISVSFFDNNEHETAASRWDRAKKRAAKVGKGLLKDEKAQTLALHHWLEAIDPRHRYGRNLRVYYDVWSERRSHQPFFYWLDIGDGKEVNLAQCPRIDLQRQCIEYLGLKEREAYEVIVEEGKLVYKKSGMLLNTDEKSKWIFVLSSSRSLYVGQKRKGSFQHSSFLSGGVTTSAGRLIVSHGILEEIWAYSGHYLPTEYHLKEFISFLEENNVDLTNVNKHSMDEVKVMDEDPISENLTSGIAGIDTSQIDVPKLDLNRTASRKWSSGVGPRIGCVRDYPMELQSQALEKVRLSPTDKRSLQYSKNDLPIPSPRPSPLMRVSPGLSNMGIPSPRNH